MNTKVRRTTHLDGKFRALYDEGLDCTTAQGCTSKPMLRVDDRTRFIVMCILHLVIRLGDYLTHFIRAFCKRLPPLVRARVQTVLNESKTNISLKGKASPDGEETWRLLAHWTIIGKTMKLPPKYISVVQEMPALLPAQGRQRDGVRQSDPQPHRPRPGRTTGGSGARPPPPQPTPEQMNATDPPRGAQPPQGQSRAPTPARPRPQHVDRGPRQPARRTGSRGRGSA